MNKKDKAKIVVLGNNNFANQLINCIFLDKIIFYILLMVKENSYKKEVKLLGLKRMEKVCDNGWRAAPHPSTISELSFFPFLHDIKELTFEKNMCGTWKILFYSTGINR